MKHGGRWLLLVGLAASVGAILVSQRLERTALQTELAQVLEEQRERARMLEENRRLTAAQPSAEELARLRADHAAITRLRQEVEALDAQASRQLADVAAPASSARPAPAATFQLTVGEGGELILAGRPVTWNELRAQLREFAARAEAVEIRMRPGAELTAARMSTFKSAMENVAALGRELHLRHELIFDQTQGNP